MDKRRATEFLGYLLRDKNIERTIYEDALKIAIESLKAQLSKESTTKDAINRQATIDAVNNAFDRETLLTGFVRSIAVRAIRDMPSVQPERKKGEWIEISSINHTYKCSECGRLLVNITDGRNNVSKHYPYCHRGADMRGEQG